MKPLPGVEAQIEQAAKEMLEEYEKQHEKADHKCGLDEAGDCAGSMVLALLRGEASPIQQKRAALMLERITASLAEAQQDQEFARGMVLLIAGPNREKGH